MTRWWDKKALEGVLHLAAKAHSAAPVAAALKELMKPLGPARASAISASSASLVLPGDGRVAPVPWRLNGNAGAWDTPDGYSY